jgi:hypothetical protein
MPTRKNSLRRRVRSAGGQMLRRLHVMPGGQPDGLGDDEQLAGAVLEGDVVVYFPDTPDSLYQLRSWYGPLLALHRERGVSVLCMDSRTAEAIRKELPVAVFTVAQDATLDALLSRSETKLILYVNYNPLNTNALRARSVVHVSLLHGDSDKGVSVSNQVKAYDFSFVAGRAAVDRYAKYTGLFDAEQRCIPVGRPYLDTEPHPQRPGRGPGDAPVVLYAPTWEGGQASVAYSSLPAYGLQLVRSLMDAGVTVIYRPHPLTGVRVPMYGKADELLRDMLEDSGGRHEVSEDHSLFEDFSRADLLICDISAVANDWLATGRPLMITVPTEQAARDAGTELLDVAPRLSEDQAEDAGWLARRQISEDPQKARRAELTEYYLGDIRPGASLERFLTACRDLVRLRDEQWARIHANQEAGAAAERNRIEEWERTDAEAD